MTWVQRSPATSPPSRSGRRDGLRQRAEARRALRGRRQRRGDSRRHVGVGRKHMGREDPTHKSAGPRPPRDGVRQRAGTRRALRGCGRRSRHFLADTWEWDGTTWVQRTPATSPPARAATRWRTTARGGASCCSGATATTPATSPTRGSGTGLPGSRGRPPRARQPAHDHAMAYDSCTGACRALRWLRRAPVRSRRHMGVAREQPGLRGRPHKSVGPRHHAMAYDSARGRMVLFGGYRRRLASTTRGSGTGTPGSRERPPRVRRPATCHAMAYDSARRRVRALRGRATTADSASPTPGNGTGRLGPKDARHESAGPLGPRDGVRQRSRDASCSSGVTGRRPLPRPTRGSGTETHGSRERPPTSPPARVVPAMAYDSARGRVVLFGGRRRGGLLADTWEWDGTTWVEKTPATSPPARDGHAMAYDSARGRVVLFGGYRRHRLSRRHLGVGRDNLDPAGRPPRARRRAIGHAMAYDSARGASCSSGATGNSGLLADTWEWDGNTWVENNPRPSPPARAYHAIVYDSARGRLVLFGGFIGSIFCVDDTWEYRPLETAGDSGFHDPNDTTVYSWPPQSGVTEYEARRSGSPHFAPPCAGTTTTATSWDDDEPPEPGAGFFYLTRPFAPYLGSWGWDSAGSVRSNVCP